MSLESSNLRNAAKNAHAQVKSCARFIDRYVYLTGAFALAAGIRVIDCAENGVKRIAGSRAQAKLSGMGKSLAAFFIEKVYQSHGRKATMAIGMKCNRPHGVSCSEYALTAFRTPSLSLAAAIKKTLAGLKDCARAGKQKKAARAQKDPSPTQGI